MREPDWAYVARSLAKVLAVSAALFLAFSAVDRVLWVFIDPSVDERIGEVYGTAARIANPDKRLSYGYGNGGGLLEASYTLQGEPRRAGASAGRTDYVIVENLFGRVRAPSLDGPAGSLNDAIDSVYPDSDLDEEAVDKEAVDKEEVRRTIDGLPQTLEAVAVVEFAHPMATDRLVAFNRRHTLCGGAGVSYIYSPSNYDDSDEPASLNAVVWNRDMTKDQVLTDLTYQCETEPEAALAEFRRWVGLLDEGDDFSEFELTYERLADTAKEGVVYGLVADRWKLADLRKLLDDPEVGTVRLTDVSFDLGKVG